MIVKVTLTLDLPDPEVFRAAFDASEWADRMGIGDETADLPVEDLAMYLADEATRVALAEDLGSGNVIDSRVKVEPEAPAVDPNARIARLEECLRALSSNIDISTVRPGKTRVEHWGTLKRWAESVLAAR